MTPLERARKELKQNQKELLNVITSSTIHIADLCKGYSNSLVGIQNRLGIYNRDIQIRATLVDKSEAVVSFLERCER